MRIQDLYIFTPGPWKADEGTIRNQAGDALGSYPWGIGDAVDHTNGRLMAAAPALLEAAIYTLNSLDNMTTAEFERGADHLLREKLIKAVMPFIDHGAK